MKSPTQSLARIGALTLLAAFCGAALAGVAESAEPGEADITRATASLLERFQFSQRPLDARLSGQILDRYMDMLDGAHLLFLQSDLDEFARFRLRLAQMTLREGRTRPVHIIYARYLKRLAQQVKFATNLLHSEKFDFTGHDSWQFDRLDVPPPRDTAEAQALWRQEAREEYLREKLVGTPAAQIAPALAWRYERLFQTMRRLGADRVLGIYLDVLARLYDPHSDYFGREEAEDFNIQMNLSLVGIGGTLQAKDGCCVVTDIIPGGPAERNGLLKPGDRIVAVGQDGAKPVNVMNLPSWQVVKLIRGPKGSTVRLTIIPAGADDSTLKTVSLVRDEIKLADAHAKAAVIDRSQTGGPALRLGVIKLASFYDGASADAARLIKKLQQEGVRGLILDLRRNGGGSLEEAIWLTGLFIPSGPVLQTRSPQDEVEIERSPETSALYDGPLVVLTSRLSASASEIVAGALQDYQRALNVGDSSTFGKGTVQTIVPLTLFFHHGGLGAVNVTIAKFYRPSGASTQLKGVVPDIVLPSATDLSVIGESQLPNPLPWDTLPPAAYTKLDLLRPMLAVLRDQSRARVAADPGFRVVLQEQAMADKKEAASSLSLNEATRRRQKAKTDDIKAEMNNILRAEKARMPLTHLITMADLDSAELPSTRKPARPLAAVAKPAASNWDDDIELRETENILADYIHALRAGPAAAIVSGAGPESGVTTAR